MNTRKYSMFGVFEYAMICSRGILFFIKASIGVRLLLHLYFFLGNENSAGLG